MSPKHPPSTLSFAMDLSAGFMKIVQTANAFHAAGSSKPLCKPFIIAGKCVGLIRPDVLLELSKEPSLFYIKCNDKGEAGSVHLSDDLTTYEARSSTLGEYLQKLRKNETFISLKDWKDESCEVVPHFNEPALMKMERAARCLFGTKQFGVHINGYLHHSTKGLCMWIGKRGAHKAAWPGKLDQMVAGGLASGQSVMDCAYKESAEEASVPEHILKNLKPCGTVSYFFEDKRGLFPLCQFVMDLEVPEDFTPVNSDGEVDSFQLIPLEEVKQLIVSDAFKFDCAVVILDFLIRHGHILPGEEPNYSQLILMMHDSHF